MTTDEQMGNLFESIDQLVQRVDHLLDALEREREVRKRNAFRATFVLGLLILLNVIQVITTFEAQDQRDRIEECITPDTRCYERVQESNRPPEGESP